MKHNIYSILSLSLFLAGFSFTASADEKMEMAKRATYDYEAGRGEITLESYVGGGAQTSGGGTTASADLDIVVVLDYSGSMADDYFLKSGEPKTYTKWYVDPWPTTVTQKSDYSGKLIQYIYKDSNNSNHGWSLLSESGKPKFTINGEAYTVTVMNVSGSGAAENDAGTSRSAGTWAYVDAKDGKRYYINSYGCTTVAKDKTEPTASTFPVDLNGQKIYPSPKNAVPFIGFPQSTSKSISNRMDALRAGVTAFIDLLRKDQVDNGTSHRIALVEFRSHQIPKFYYRKDYERDYYLNSSYPDYYLREISGQQINTSNDAGACGLLKNFTELCSEANCQSLKCALHYKDQNGNTAIDKGVQIGVLTLNSFSRDNVNKVIVVFTDGEPTSADATSSTKTDWSVGTRAVQYAKPVKYAGGKIKYPVYTVYCGGSSALSSTSDIYKFMNALSSNYPQADTYNDLVESEKNPKQTYFKDAAVTGLIGAFQQIGDAILAEIKSKYGSATKLIDYIASSFKLPSNIVKSDIKVYTRPCKGYDSSSKKYEWKTDSTDITSSVTVTIDATSSPQSVSVTGYDYSANWCGTLNGTAHGSKVMVKIPFELKDKTASGNLPTNTDQSGVYVKEGDNYKKDEVYNVPKIPFCSLKITRTDLEPGESAVYIITDKNGNFVDKIVLCGTGGTVVEKNVYGVPGDYFTVTETDWNWAYNKGTNPQTKFLPDSPTKYELQYDFTGKHIEPTGTTEEKEKNPANRHNHDESCKVNSLTIP